MRRSWRETRKENTRASLKDDRKHRQGASLAGSNTGREHHRQGASLAGSITGREHRWQGASQAGSIDIAGREHHRQGASLAGSIAALECTTFVGLCTIMHDKRKRWERGRGGGGSSLLCQAGPMAYALQLSCYGEASASIHPWQKRKKKQTKTSCFEGYSRSSLYKEPSTSLVPLA